MSLVVVIHLLMFIILKKQIIEQYKCLTHNRFTSTKMEMEVKFNTNMYKILVKCEV